MTKNIFKVDILSLGISQIYLNKRKIKSIGKWFNIDEFDKYDPLPVYDFGNGRLTLTDGHTRAYIAYKLGISELWVAIDKDELITDKMGQAIYKNSILWCDRFHLKTIPNLENRIISNEEYQILWEQRCERMYHLIANKHKLKADHEKDLFLYGAEPDLSVKYYEDKNGSLFKMIHGHLTQETFE
ncbi:MAG: hypothetical protein WBI07_14455 [Mobilitalea sp.]